MNLEPVHWVWWEHGNPKPRWTYPKYPMVSVPGHSPMIKSFIKIETPCPSLLSGVHHRILKCLHTILKGAKTKWINRQSSSNGVWCPPPTRGRCRTTSPRSHRGPRSRWTRSRWGEGGWTSLGERSYGQTSTQLEQQRQGAQIYLKMSCLSFGESLTSLYWMT